jgi:hypothetical protein
MRIGISFKGILHDKKAEMEYIQIHLKQFKGMKPNVSTIAYIISHNLLKCVKSGNSHK